MGAGAGGVKVRPNSDESSAGMFTVLLLIRLANKVYDYAPILYIGMLP